MLNIILIQGKRFQFLLIKKLFKFLLRIALNSLNL